MQSVTHGQSAPEIILSVECLINATHQEAFFDFKRLLQLSADVAQVGLHRHQLPDVAQVGLHRHQLLRHIAVVLQVTSQSVVSVVCPSNSKRDPPKAKENTDRQVESE